MKKMSISSEGMIEGIRSLDVIDSYYLLDEFVSFLGKNDLQQNYEVMGNNEQR
jgi:hypothetical protein